MSINYVSTKLYHIFKTFFLHYKHFHYSYRIAYNEDKQMSHLIYDHKKITPDLV
jgi:hypothetical protein